MPNHTKQNRNTNVAYTSKCIHQKGEAAGGEVGAEAAHWGLLGGGRDARRGTRPRERRGELFAEMAVALSVFKLQQKRGGGGE